MKKIKGDRDLSRIVFTLGRGHFEGASRKKFFAAYSFLVSICAGLLTLAVTMMSIEQINDPTPVEHFVGGIIGATIAFTVLPLFTLIFVIRNEKIRKEVLLWVEDAVELTAVTKTLDVKHWIGIPQIKLQISFKVDGVPHVCTTEKERQSWTDYGRPVGYFSWISKYADKEVNILYSQKYDQVMILKNKK